MKFDVNQYINTHGTNPKGNGCWLFDFGGGRVEAAPGILFYTEAKRWASKRAKELGLSSKDTILVCP